MEKTVTAEQASMMADNASAPSPPADALPAEPQAERLRFFVNDHVGEMEIEIPLDMTVVPLNAESAQNGLIRVAKLKGVDNNLYLGEDADTGKVTFDIIGVGNKIIVGRGARLKGMMSMRGNNNIIFIGAGTTFNSAALIAKYSANIYIGKDCMFSSGIEIRTSDSHSIVDLETMKKSNDTQGIFIGDHVWVGKGVIVQKGSAIGEDNVIGIGSFVRGAFDESSTLIVGSPARVVRKGKSWARNELFDAEKEDLYAWRQMPLI